MLLLFCRFSLLALICVFVILLCLFVFALCYTCAACFECLLISVVDCLGLGVELVGDCL